MNIFIGIIFGVYLAAVNFYGFMLVKEQKRDEEERGTCSNRDGKIFVTGLIGGAPGVYVSMFIFRFRLTSLPLMVFMPVFVALNVLIAIKMFSGGYFGQEVETTTPIMKMFSDGF